MGEIGILNVGEGDTKLTFDPKNPQEMKRAARIVTDMLKRGFMILVEHGTDPETGEALYRRVKSFREDTCEYLITGDASDSEDENEQQGAKTTERKTRGKRGRTVGTPRLVEKAVPASTAKGIAVGRVAGG